MIYVYQLTDQILNSIPAELLATTDLTVGDFIKIQIMANGDWRISKTNKDTFDFYKDTTVEVANFYADMLLDRS